MGLFFKQKKTPRELCEEPIDKLLQTERPLIDNYFGNLMGSTVKLFDQNFSKLGPADLTSPIMLMDAMMADCMHASNRVVSKTYRSDLQGIALRYDLFKQYLGAIDRYTEEDKKAARIVCELFIEFKTKEFPFLYIDQLFKMKLPELLPAALMDEIGEEYLAKDRFGAFFLYNSYLPYNTPIDGKINYTVAKLLYERNPEKYADYIKARLEKAKAADYPDTDDLYQKVLGAADDHDDHDVVDDKDAAEMQALLEAADRQYAADGDPEVYYRLFGERVNQYEPGPAKEIAFQAGCKYSDAIDQIAAAGGIQQEQLPLLYKQRRVHCILAGNKFEEYYSRGADALRDGYGNIPQDFKSARIFYAMAAKGGDRHAALYNGIFYKDGIGGDVDYKQALDYFYTVLKNGPVDLLTARAAHHLHQMFQDGLGVDQDPEAIQTLAELSEEGGWTEQMQGIYDIKIKLGNFLKEHGDNPEYVKEIVARCIDPDTGSIVLPPLV